MFEFWITTLAIIVGPLAAVLVTVSLERRRRNYERRHNVFRSLMKTRRTALSPEHVEALNLIEIEYHGNTNVQASYKKLFEYFVDGISKRDDEDQQSFDKRTAERHSDLLSALLLEMSKDLGYKKDQFEILRGGYSPILHGQIEEDQGKIRKLFAGLHDGNMAIPIAVTDFRHPEAILKQVQDEQAIAELAKKNSGPKKTRKTRATK